MTRENLGAALWCVLGVLALPPNARAQLIRLGTEFQVNAHTASFQTYPSAGVADDGDFVVAWASFQDGSNDGVFARRFASSGVPLGGELQVNTYTDNSQGVPKAAVETDGDFVVAWVSTGQDGDSVGVFARRFSSAGAALTGELQVNTFTSGSQLFADIAAGIGGEFVVVWASDGQDGSSHGVFARRFSSDGAPLATEFQVNAYTETSQRLPAVAMLTGGDFVVVWESGEYQDGSAKGIFARRLSSAGTLLGGEFQVNTYTTGAQELPALAATADGFVVAWTSYGQDGSDVGVFARRFSSAGAPLATEFQVSTYTSLQQRVPKIASDAAGDFVVVWTSYAQDGYGYGLFARSFSSAGSPTSGEFQVHTYTSGFQDRPSVAAAPGGAFVVAWSGQGQGASNTDVFAQRFAAAITLDIDADGSAQALTDGLLVLRYQFGFRGATLTSGAISAGCTRCDAAAIEPYIAGLGLMLDVDGNATTEPLTDGLLALRFLFGFTGATLTSGAVGGGCTRCDAAAIEPYLMGLT